METMDTSLGIVTDFFTQCSEFRRFGKSFGSACRSHDIFGLRLNVEEALSGPQLHDTLAMTNQL